MAVDIYGNIINEQGVKTGGAVNLQTGASVLSQDQLNTIANQSGYTGGTFTSVGLPKTPVNPTSPITSNDLTNQGNVNLPPLPQDNGNYMGIINAGQELAKLLSQPAQTTDLNQLYSTLYGQSGIGEKETKAAESQSQLDILNAEMAALSKEAEAISLYDPAKDPANVGRGITVAGIRPLQMEKAEQLRQIAIRSLPIQGKILAQQAVATRDQRLLDAAQEKFDRAFQIQLKQVEMNYNARKEQRDRIFDILDKAEQQRLNARQKKDDRDFQIVRDQISYVQGLAKTAMENGQASLASQLTQLDPNSPSYMIEAGKLAGQITPNGSQKAVDTVTVGDKVYQWNPKTQRYDIPVGGIESAVNTTNTQSQIAFLRESVKSATNLASASGASGISKFIGDKLVGDTKYRRLEALTNTLRTNVLTLMTDPAIKKFFGPQMSESDVRLMTSAGTTLNPENQSPSDLKTELTRLDSLFQRMQNAVNLGTQTITTTKSGQPFDLQGALNAGWKQTEINAFLNAK